VSLKLLVRRMLTAVLLGPLAVLLGQVLARDNPRRAAHSDRRWCPHGRRAVPRACSLAIPRSGTSACLRRFASSQATRDASTVAFESFHRYLGIGIGGMPRLFPYRRMDDARRRRDAPVLRVHGVARLGGDHRGLSEMI